MRKLAIVLCLYALVGCEPHSDDVPQSAAHGVSPKAPMSFREQQEHLFHKIDHKLVYQGCQELLRRHREGILSTDTYYCDDTAAKLSELPEPVRALQAAAVQVDELMVRMIFFSEDGVQHLECVSNEFGEPVTSEEGTKGLGFRKDPFAMDRLSGTESLEYLNANYTHFHMTLIPGLTYNVYPDESPRTLEEVKRMAEGMNQTFALIQKMADELVVKKQRLLHRTDHPALLAACRDVIRRSQEGAFSSTSIRIMPQELLREATHINREEYERDLKQIPEIILGLEPVRIDIHEDRVEVVLIGGLDHAGVYAYRDDGSIQPRPDTMKLIDGLWYYDDGLEEAGDEYREYLRSLKDEALAPIDWQRKTMGMPLPQRE